MPEIAHRGSQSPIVEYHAANRPWRMKIPPVYRFLPEEFVDRFFDSGELRLSSFSKFTKHTDEARLDIDEGRAYVVASSPDRTFGALIDGGRNSYVLCGSTTLSRELVNTFVGTNAAIEITQIGDFGLAVARQLSGFVSGVSGHCIYAGRILNRHVRADPVPLPKGQSRDIPIESLFEAVGAASLEDDMFLKDIKYAGQGEYRLIWNLDKPSDDTITIFAPDAIQFCRKVAMDEIP